MPPASGHVLNDATSAVDAGEPAVTSSVGRARTRGGTVALGLQRDDQPQSDSEDGDTDRFYSLQLAHKTARCDTNLYYNRSINRRNVRLLLTLFTV